MASNRARRKQVGERPVVVVPPAICEPATSQYDRVRCPFAELVLEALGVDSLEALSTLHETKDGRKAQAHPPRAGQDNFRRRWRCFLDQDPSARARLDAMVRDFVEAEVVRHFGEPAVYQAEPTLRVHLAGTGRALGVPHVDADYFHQPGEVNWWLPLTPCWGSNTLWCESAPDAADYAPFELPGAGSYRRFWANQLRHYTLPNETGSTRVSLDLRAVPLSLFVPDWASPKGSVPFALGFYYRSTAEDAEQAGLLRRQHASRERRLAEAAELAGEQKQEEEEEDDDEGQALAWLDGDGDAAAPATSARERGGGDREEQACGETSTELPQGDVRAAGESSAVRAAGESSAAQAA